MFPLTITAIDRIIFKGDVTSVTCRGALGELTVLKDHVPFVTPLGEGNILVRIREKTEIFPAAKGFLTVSRKETIILI